MRYQFLLGECMMAQYWSRPASTAQNTISMLNCTNTSPFIARSNWVICKTQKHAAVLA
jgi:hypothetical protein